MSRYFIVVKGDEPAGREAISKHGIVESAIKHPGRTSEALTQFVIEGDRGLLARALNQWFLEDLSQDHFNSGSLLWYREEPDPGYGHREGPS